jgi:predicted RND superfamily exporter protein
MTAKEIFAGSAAVYAAWALVISAAISESVFTDIRVLVPIVVIVLLGVLVFLFRRFSYVTLALLAVIVGTLWAIGSMPLLGIALVMLSSAQGWYLRRKARA